MTLLSKNGRAGTAGCTPPCAVCKGSIFNDFGAARQDGYDSDAGAAAASWIRFMMVRTESICPLLLMASW